MNQLEQSCLRAQAELEQALAVPRATRQLVAWLPLITLFLSVAAGLVSIDALLSPISLACVLLGLALLLLGLWLTKRMLQQVEEEFFLRELQDFSIAISSGLTLAQVEKLFPHLPSNSSVNRLTKPSQKTGARLSDLVSSEIESSLRQYAIATLAGVAFAGLMLLIMRSEEVRQLLFGLVARALGIQ